MFEKFTHTSHNEKAPSREDIQTASAIRAEITKGIDRVTSKTADALLELDDEHIVLFDVDFFNTFGETYEVLQFGDTFDTKGMPTLIETYGTLSIRDIESRKRLAQEIRKVIK